MTDDGFRDCGFRVVIGVIQGLAPMATECRPSRAGDFFAPVGDAGFQVGEGYAAGDGEAFAGYVGVVQGTDGAGAPTGPPAPNPGGVCFVGPPAPNPGGVTPRPPGGGVVPAAGEAAVELALCLE